MKIEAAFFLRIKDQSMWAWLNSYDMRCTMCCMSYERAFIQLQFDVISLLIGQNITKL